MTIKQKIKLHFHKKIYCKITRKVTENEYLFSNGYIIDYSKDFLLISNCDEFRFDGYCIFPILSITEIRFNKNDKYYDKIIKSEKLDKHFLKKHEIDLSNWNSIFKTIRKTGLNVIIENEDPEDTSFDIGPIIKVTKTAVYIQYFDATGFLDKLPTRIPWDKITVVTFDDNYSNTFSKYLRNRKK